jgi:hypothetical protein
MTEQKLVTNNGIPDGHPQTPCVCGGLDPSIFIGTANEK